jgi:hypothetical protein
MANKVKYRHIRYIKECDRNVIDDVGLEESKRNNQ